FRGDETVPVEGWCTGEEPVILLRVTLGHDPTLPPSGRAADPVTKPRTSSVEGLRDRLSLSSEFQFGAFGKVFDQADIQGIGGVVQYKPATAEAVVWGESRVASIGRGRRVSSLHCSSECGPRNRACISAAPHTSEPVIPDVRKGQPNLDVDRWRDH